MKHLPQNAKALPESIADDEILGKVLTKGPVEGKTIIAIQSYTRASLVHIVSKNQKGLLFPVIYFPQAGRFFPIPNKGEAWLANDKIVMLAVEFCYLEHPKVGTVYYALIARPTI